MDGGNGKTTNNNNKIRLMWERDIESRIRNLLNERIREVEASNQAIEASFASTTAKKGPVDRSKHQAKKEEQQQSSSSSSCTPPESTTTTNHPLLRLPVMIGIVGIPGSGKTTSSRHLVRSLSDVGCMLMPMDGYHYSKAALQCFPNAENALYRRGAPDTFDAATMVADLRSIKCNRDIPNVSVPGFDHAVGDPEPAKYTFDRSVHNVVICEGLYLLHDADGWDAVREYFDFTVYVDAAIDACMERVKVRNRVIPGYTVEEILRRVDAVDRINAETVVKSKQRATVVVPSAAL